LQDVDFVFLQKVVSFHACHNSIIKIVVTELVCGLQELKTKIKGVFTGYVVAMATCYLKKDDRNLFTNDWAFV